MVNSGCEDEALIGVDGGATKVIAVQVLYNPSAPYGSFRLGTSRGEVIYSRIEEFEPLPVEEQLRQRSDRSIDIDEVEREQGRRFVEGAGQAILKTVMGQGAKKLRVGIGMPGLKTADCRGIEVMNNGPRIPDYLDQLETFLTTHGLELASSIRRLGSDADYCGLGEEFGQGGAFTDVAHAYYIGGGSGLADALKLRGLLLPLDAATTWLLKSWQIRSSQGETFERVISPKSINLRYAALKGDLDTDVFPELNALRGDPHAIRVLHEAADALAELVFERLTTLCYGRVDAAHHGAAYRALTVEHDYRGTVLDRVVIGQRLGDLMANNTWSSFFREPFQSRLAILISDSGGPEIKRATLSGATIRTGFVISSALREAPALGAAVNAVYAGV